MAENFLADYAIRPAQTARKFPEPEPEELTCFQCDRNRILRCSAFRRLDYKTQVFVPHEHDMFRTRLTHTLEVAQVGRDLGRALGLNEDLIETVALGHDLGHPPFGHVGEYVLDALMAEHGHFEHNRQSLRVVDYLEHPYPQFRGLNLTNVARECIAKHETRYDTPVCEDFQDTQAPLPPLEGQVVELADEIAYTSADLEDALMSKWISQNDLGELALWQRAVARAEKKYPQARPIHIRIQATQGLVTILCENLLAVTRENIISMGIDSPNAVRRAEGRCMRFSRQLAEELRELQDFLLQRVYKHDENLKQQQQATKILRHLFKAFINNPQLLPERYHQRIAGDQTGDDLYRVVCDYLAGMTDRFCREIYEKQILN